MPVFDPDNPTNQLQEYPMRIQPKTDDQLAREGLRDPGIYDFSVIEAIDGVSQKSGNPMITLKLEVFDPNGGSFFLKDYLTESMGFKLKHLMQSVGLSADYEAGEIDAGKLQGRSGRLVVKIEEDKTGQYLPKNAVKDYVAQEAPEAPAPKAAPKRPEAVAAPVDDTIPFMRTDELGG